MFYTNAPKKIFSYAHFSYSAHAYSHARRHAAAHIKFRLNDMPSKVYPHISPCERLDLFFFLCNSFDRICLPVCLCVLVCARVRICGRACAYKRTYTFKTHMYIVMRTHARAYMHMHVHLITTVGTCLM
jgi:hypothetical protein